MFELLALTAVIYLFINRKKKVRKPKAQRRAEKAARAAAAKK